MSLRQSWLAKASALIVGVVASALFVQVGAASFPNITIFGRYSGAPKAIVVDSTGRLLLSSSSTAGVPGGSTTQVQFNDASAFGGDSGMVYAKATDQLTVAGRIISGHDNNTLVGTSAGAALVGSAGPNVFLGDGAGAAVTTGNNDVLVGSGLADTLSTGNWNVIVGNNAADHLTTGGDNVIIGDSAASSSIVTASQNVIIGSSTSFDYLGGNNNVVIGMQAGDDVVAGNVVLGYQTAKNAGTISNQLWIDNSSTATPLLYGDFSTDALTVNGSLTVTASVVLATGTAFETDTTTAHTALLRAYDADDATYRTFGTLTNGNTPSFVLAAPTGGTLTVTGRLQTSGSTPSVANVAANSCGTSAATIAGNDNAGEVTVGATAGTQCRIAFTAAATNRWDCTVTDSTTTIATRATYVDTTHVDLFGAFVAGDVVTYVCVPR